MAGIFKGSLFSSLQENHQFFSKNDVLKDIGLSSFTLRSCSQIYNSQADEIKNIFPSAPNSLENNQTILNIANVSQGSYIKFDKLSKRFDSQETIVSLSDVIDLINYHENQQLGSDPNSQLNNVLLEINNSFFKCLRFRGSLFDQDILVTLFFQNKNRRSNERTIANKNKIMIAAPPVTPFGKHYSIQSINNAFQENFGNNNSPVEGLADLISINNEKHNFAYPAKDWPTAQSNFYENSVAAPIQLSYDQNTNTWKSGNPSVLARLLEDLDEAELKDGDNLADNRTNINDWIDENSDIYVGGFTVGTAIPLSIEKSNPYLFSPNFVKEKGEKKVATMKVVNRSARSYKKGDLVMLTEINGEWIPQDFGEGAFSEPGPAQLGEWTFIKLVANSDAYFKYDSFRDTGIPATDITINVYELGVRNVFFKNVQSVLAKSYSDFYSNKDLEDLIKLNTMSTESRELIPSKNYLIASIFDQLPEKLGGFSVDSLKILRNNNRTIRDTDNAFGDQVGFNPSFIWGPLYTQGYRSLVVNPEVSESNLFSSSFVTANLSSEFSSYFVNDPTERRQSLSETPAEMTSKLFDLTYLFSNWSLLGTSRFDLNKATATIKPPYYGSVASNNSVQFSALALELIGSNYDGIGGKFRGTDESIKDRALVLAQSLSESEENFSNLLGNMITRSKTHGYESDSVELLCDVRRRNTNPPFANKGGGAGPAGVFQPDLSTFNCPGRNVGNDGASIAGIIGAKNTISKSGGSIIFSVDQNFGSLVSRSVGGGQGPSLSIIPLGGGIPLFTPGTDSRTSSIPTWGSSQDNPWSFGTLALHVRVFDSWPENQTIFDPRYFSILHFNPGNLGSLDEDISVDFLVPADENKKPLKSGVIINDKFKLGAPVKNTIRRGQLLTNGGFWYFKNVIGLNEFRIVDGGENFALNDEIRLPKGAIAIVTSVDNGKLTGFKFKEIKTEIADYELRGENVLATDFNTEVEEDFVGPFGVTKELKKVLRVSVSSPAGGKPAIIHFSSGIVYKQAFKDMPPFEHTGGNAIRLTDSSNNGSVGYIRGNRETSIGVSGGSRKYDCFFHFHNDAGIYSLNEISSPQQHIILKVS
jgi:hypothetical protein